MPEPKFSEIVDSIEELCDSLRELRRKDPKAFYMEPVETLYRRLEIALDTYYRDRTKPT